jgi:leucyl-tRNA synthetase
MEVACPKCSGAARRDADTMDTFVDSAWYFLRYLSPNDDERPWPREIAERWLPIYQYSGGIEHATLHLLYSRFMIKALRDLGHVSFGEPFRRLIHQGTITNQGAKMSKSRGNVISPDEYIAEHGADAFRVYMEFGFSWTEGGDWKDEGIRAVAQWLQRVWRLVRLHGGLWEPGARLSPGDPGSEASKGLVLARHRSVKGATDDLAAWQFNTAIARVMELVNACYQYSPVDQVTPQGISEPLLKEGIETVIRLLAPIAPHLAEELWAITGHESSVVDTAWPSYDPAILATVQVTMAIQINGKVRERMQVPRDLPDEDVKSRALAHGRIPTLIDGKPLKKAVVVPNKLVSLVV